MVDGFQLDKLKISKDCRDKKSLGKQYDVGGTS